MTSGIFWLIYMALVFWALYQKWDEKRDKFVTYPYITTVYFLIGSAVLTAFFPHVLNFFIWDTYGILALIGVVLMTFVLYSLLKIVRHHKSNWFFFDYFALLDNRYVIPKLTEILFQQIFFVSVFVISLNTFGESLTLFVTVLAFFFAHLNLFLFRGIREAFFYLIFSLFGAPIFVMFLIYTEVLWYSIAVHMFFYTALSFVAWIWGEFKKS
jgi:uncharacterized membrane protein (DUF485 family)